jgi:hypothetical protein
VKLWPVKLGPVKVWRVLGVAGLAGVAATGAVLVRDQRRRAQLTPEQVRAQLHERLASTHDHPA